MRKLVNPTSKPQLKQGSNIGSQKTESQAFLFLPAIAIITKENESRLQGSEKPISPSRRYYKKILQINRN